VRPVACVVSTAVLQSSEDSHTYLFTSTDLGPTMQQNEWFSTIVATVFKSNIPVVDQKSKVPILVRRKRSPNAILALSLHNTQCVSHA